LDAESLVSLVYTRPVIHLVKEELNTFIAISKIEINPMSNLIFIEDQQILTSKGIILCNSIMAARKFENEVIRTCYDILRIPVVSECPPGMINIQCRVFH
jgi:arginine deiminase